jgi:LemA protein
MLILLGLVIAVAIVYFIMLYNRLVQIKHNVSTAWANIDVILKQRHDELPKLVEVCRQYMKFEAETLARVVDARSNVATAREQRDIGALGRAEGALRSAVGNLFALAESYPDLKTSATFTQLQGRISALENAIADRREFYNESVNVNNVRIEQFPDSIVAGAFKFRPFELLQFQAGEITDVDMKKLFTS